MNTYLKFISSLEIVIKDVNELLFRSLHFYVPIISTDIQNEWYNFVADNARYSNHKKISYHKDFFIWRCCGSLMHSLVWRIFPLTVDRWKFRALSATCIATRFYSRMSRIHRVHRSFDICPSVKLSKTRRILIH